MGSGSATTQDQRRDRGFTQRSRPERSRRRKRTQHGRKTWGEVVSGRSHEGAPPPCPAPPCSAQREATPRQRPHHCSPRRVALPAPGIRTGHLKMLLLQPLRSVLGLRVPPGNHVLPKTSQCDLLGRGGRRRCNHHMRSLWSRRAFIQRDRCPQMQQRDTEPRDRKRPEPPEARRGRKTVPESLWMETTRQHLDFGPLVGGPGTAATGTDTRLKVTSAGPGLKALSPPSRPAPGRSGIRMPDPRVTLGGPGIPSSRGGWPPRRGSLRAGRTGTASSGKETGLEHHNDPNTGQLLLDALPGTLASRGASPHPPGPGPKGTLLSREQSPVAPSLCPHPPLWSSPSKSQGGTSPKVQKACDGSADRSSSRWTPVT